MAALLATACLLLATCADPAPGATSLPAALPAATSPQATPAPSVPPALPSPTLTAEPSPTAVPSPTVSPTPSPTPSPSPTAAPTQARSAAGSSNQVAGLDAQLETARRYQTNGDYAEAIAAYQAILDGQPAAEQAGQARYHLAECLLLDEDYAGSVAAWESFIAASAGDPLLPQAHLMAGRAYRALGDCRQARPHLEAYLAGDGTLADMVYEWLGDCDAEEGAWDEAIAAYRQALAAAGDRSTEVGLREEVAGVYLAQNQVAPAVAEYDAILAVARQAPYRAKIEYLAGKALAADGQIEAAQTRYRRAVDKYPQAESAYLALVELVDAEAPVDEFQRGLVDYYAGAAYPDAYGAAVRAFDRYLELKPAPKADEALYRKALAQRALGQTDAALETLDRVLIEYPRSTWQAAASFETAATLAEAGEEDLAVKAYQDMAGFFPADKQAPEALWQAARLRNRAGAYAEAAALYERLQSDFPGSDQAEEALWRAGLAHYRDGARQSAVEDWQALLAKYPTSGFRLPSLYWLGKLGIKPTDAGQPGYWDQLVRSYPHNFYALRAKQMRSGGSLTSARMVVEPIQPLLWDETQAEADLLHWLRGWTAVPTDTHLVDLPARLAQRSDVKKGRALLAVGLRREALAAFDAVRSAAWNDPVALAQLAFSFRREGLYGLSARCAARLAGLWPKGLVEDAPPALQQLAYPLAYADLLSAEAVAQGLDPLLLAAVIRQESLFEPTAESYAGARGLGQVMPATGEGIAQSLGMDDFALDDLYRPSVSVRFAAFYLGVQLGRFDDQILVALAAYNGGPGNTLRWLEAGGDDLDLFVETITAEQSRHYLQRVYEQYVLYEELAR